MKKIIIVDILVVFLVLILSYTISLLSNFLLTDLVFIGSMLVLATSVILLISARKDMKAAIKRMKKSEKKETIKVFQWSEKLAMSFVVVTGLLFFISFSLI